MSTNCSLHRLEISAGLATVAMTQMARGDPIDPDFTRKLKENSMKVFKDEVLTLRIGRAWQQCSSCAGPSFQEL
jgi:hypothetical protein